ncbi:calcium/proton exchanger [Kwoniella shandongensis]|uniref:Calcium/proton exchanger n=1 Tax=Kwoniella shandongensis TaxID=1734106 RepID=A0A5M6CBZ3_9TREE|nr:calcium/proton exchanger [Kwoniella shandongensis]KAA5530619.1 calcium/proton exchanger [Kwoniella shandongensis]
MTVTPILEPEPEPDIEGHHRPYSQDNHNNHHNHQEQEQEQTEPTPTSTHSSTTVASTPPVATTNTTNTDSHDVLTLPLAVPIGSTPPLEDRTVRSKDFFTPKAILNPQPRSKSRPGHARYPSITITSVEDAQTAEDNNGDGGKIEQDGHAIAAIRSNSEPALPTSTAATITRNRLAPLKGLSIPLPPKMGPPGGEEETKVKKHFEEPTWKQCFRNTIKSQPALCITPVLLPIAWALHFTHQNPVAVFVVSLIGIVPLAGGLGFATEELAHRVGEAWGGLLNASFGNAVELLIAILALVKGDIDIVQASMVGSILSNVLLVLGMSYFAGGLRFHEQLYTIIGAQMHISLLGISLMAIVLPAAYHYAYPSTSEIVNSTRNGALQPEGEELNNLLKMSRGLSFILLAVYAMFLTFQLYTHAYLFRIPREKVQHPLPGPAPHHEHVFPRPHWVDSIVDSSSSSSSSSASSIRSGRSERHSPFRRFRRFSVSSRAHERRHEADVENALASGLVEGEKTLSPTATDGTPRTPTSPTHTSDTLHPPTFEHSRHRDIESQSSSSSSDSSSEVYVDDDGTVHVQPKVRFAFAMLMLCAMTGLAGITAECLVGSIDGLTETGNISREFVGLILLPVIGNSVEHITAVTVSVKDKLNLSMSIAVGSSIQVSLCLLPILVLVGWAIGQPMLLFFDTFETIALVISVLLVNFAISDGRTNYLEGFVMMMAYLSIALVCWFYDPAV